jgi:hypothetical protein
MFYQHGVGKSRLGFPKILDVTSYMDNMTRASLNFQRNYLSENTLDIILDRIIKDKRMPVKTYGISLEAYNEPVVVNEEEIEEAFDWDEGTEQPIQSKPVNTTAVEYTNHSGGAYGGDTFWDQIGREYGVTEHKHYRETSNAGLSQQLKKAGVEATVLTKEQMDTARAEVKRILGLDFADNLQGNLQVRNYYQVANSDAVFAIAEIEMTTDKSNPNLTDSTKSKYSYFSNKVKGGTNTAVQLGIKLGKPVYVWDLKNQFWTKFDGKNFVQIDTPVLTKNFAGVGSRDIESYNVKDKDGNWVVRPQYKGKQLEEAAKQAIRDVYEKTFNQTQLVVKPKGEEVKEGIYLNQQALTKEEQLELFNYLKPYLETQGAKTNKSANASKMIGLGLRWDYKNNNSGKTAVDTGDIILPASKSKYGYYDTSINNQPLGPITDRFRELMSKASGLDMTNYDGAIINLYENDTFISSHNDVDESITAIKYPVIGVNLGGDGNFSIEPRDGSSKQTLDLSPGAAYVFGVDGVNREVYHRTFPTEQKSFLPQITTKLDGKTYPAGSYRVTVTMRRIMPITPDMPTSPGPVSDQYSDEVLSLQEQLNLLNNELVELEARQEEAFENDPYLLIAMNLPKIKPESARKETGVKVGTGRDINPSLLSKDGYTVTAAAHYIKEFAFYEESGRQLLDEQEIRNEIVQILQIGKENYMRDYNMQYEIDEKKAEIQDVQNRINTEQGLVNLTSIQEDFGAKFKQAFIDNGNKMPDTFEAVPGKSTWALNKDTNLYSLVDNDGVVLMEDVSMILGRIVNTKKSNKPVSNRRKQQDLLSLRSIALDLEMNSLMAIKGYDINDFISKLEAAQTESEYNEIMSKIRELLC